MIYVITAVHNRINITKEFIKKLQSQTIVDELFLVLVDDGCTDGTAEYVKEHFLSSYIISGNGNLWWGGAMDIALKWVVKNASMKKDYVMISNDDVNFGYDYIERAIRKLESEKENTLVSGIGVSVNTGKYKTTPVLWDFKMGKGQSVGPGEYANCVATRSLFFRAEDISKIGGFHPILIPHYQSDYEWTIRAVRKGFEIKSYPDLTYQFDEKTCGLGNYRKLTLKQIFSKKASCNPFYRFFFYVLVTPVKYLPQCFMNQALRIVRRG